MEFDDVGSSDLRELWESYLAESAMVHDVPMTTRDEDWGSASCSGARDKTTPGVVLRDRLMTDAALGGPRPIKSEHSYSLLASSPPASPAIPSGNDTPDTPNENPAARKSAAATPHINGHQVLVLRNRIDDMEEECFPAISLNRASGRGAGAESPSLFPSPSSAAPSPSQSPSPTCTSLDTATTTATTATAKNTSTLKVPIKDEPFSPSRSVNYSSKLAAVETIAIAPYQLHFERSETYATSDSEDDEAEYYQGMELEESNGEPSTGSSSSMELVIAGGNGSGNGNGRQGLPPTPPSSASSDSEGAASASCSPERRVSESLRGLLSPRFCGVRTAPAANRGGHMNGHVTRQPIHTPLISCQPKGSTGILTLTEEEKRTLIAEGYPVPTKLPLTKQEEKSLKKVRRKIKNKISAQESRRKKKEYMDGLERRVTLLAQENSSYKDRLTTLEGTNRELLRELQRLQAMLRSS
ncbi:cyclic AMP response element-binding protein A-like isoform X1 [Athalia rosae]|uniref:cyclic AMP response element-binding protein A-like isoform X1 n=2 Tax=Athalia rosae TaxID=37344 RepID=UPI0020342443|nr:cyclic AMP response element-binding protein A-like isoform X1 [Athalia rosae]